MVLLILVYQALVKKQPASHQDSQPAVGLQKESNPNLQQEFRPVVRINLVGSRYQNGLRQVNLPFCSRLIKKCFHTTISSLEFQSRNIFMYTEVQVVDHSSGLCNLIWVCYVDNYKILHTVALMPRKCESGAHGSNNFNFVPY